VLVAALAAVMGAGSCDRRAEPAPGAGRASASAPSTAKANGAASGGAALPSPVPTSVSSARAAPLASDPLPETVDDEPADVHAESCASADPALAPMQLLRFTFTDGIEGRDPRSRLTIARPGQRVYLHLTMRNRSGRERCVRVTFRAAGHRRSEVTLTVGKSWSWRTWAYATLRPDDRGPLVVEVRDDQGALVAKRSLAVAAPR